MRGGGWGISWLNTVPVKILLLLPSSISMSEGSIPIGQTSPTKIEKNENGENIKAEAQDFWRKNSAQFPKHRNLEKKLEFLPTKLTKQSSKIHKFHNFVKKNLKHDFFHITITNFRKNAKKFPKKVLPTQVGIGSRKKSRKMCRIKFGKSPIL